MNPPLTKAERELMAKIGRRGGEARKRNLTREQLAKIGRMGAKARLLKRNGQSAR